MDQHDEVDRPSDASVKDVADPSLKTVSSTNTQPDKNLDECDDALRRNGEVLIEKNGTLDDGSLSESLSSLMLFHEEYDNLDVTDYPHPDPSADPESSNNRNLNGVDSTDFPLMIRSKSKIKAVVRSKIKVEDILSTHTTFFPYKPGENHEQFSPKYVNVSSDHYYDMNTFPRGIMIVFNVEHYLEETGMSDYPRKGTERDADGLCALFLELGFIVERVDNPTMKMVFSIMDKVASEGNSISCCGCIVLTHGEAEILYAIDGFIRIKDLAKCFRKKSLAGKPKLFFFQACRGCDYMDSIEAVDGPFKEDKDLALPCEADFFYAYSTVPGYYSWRNSRNGSWFMQSLCTVFRRRSHYLDLYRMLTHVNDQVSERKSNTDNAVTDDKRQIASLVSQMRKELFFFPPYGPLVNSSNG